jgi:prepilin-type N-terminal cleavage/methylation domain-containing protein
MFRDPDRRFPRSSVGFSLVEVLVSTALFSLVLASMYLLYTTMLGTMSRGEMFSDLQQNARVGLQRMVQDVRMAGYDPSNAIPSLATPPQGFIRAATAGCLSFIGYQVQASADLTYRISYYLDPVSGVSPPIYTLKRLAEPWVSTTFGASGGAQPLAENIAALTLTYYDQDNRNIVPTGAWTSTPQCPSPVPPPPALPPPLLTANQLALVYRIGISIKTRDTRPRTSLEYYTLDTYVQLRNR